MFELVQVNEKTYYIESPAKIGVYVADGTDVYLIDSGNDKDAGRKIRKLLDEKGWTLKGILNTHSKADHIGGNDYLQRQRKCKVFAGIETALYSVSYFGNVLQTRLSLRDLQVFAGSGQRRCRLPTPISLRTLK